MDKLLDVRGLVVNPQNRERLLISCRTSLRKSILLSPWMHEVQPICIDQILLSGVEMHDV
jgi:hypothetical protein